MHFLSSKMDTPCILINSCSDFSAGNIVKEILQVETLPEVQNVIDNVTGYDWHVDTKYYTAEAKLCVTEGRTIGDETFAEAVHAFVVYFDPDKTETFQLMKSWGPYLEQIDPEIKMLVCDQCTEAHKVDRLTVQTWCIDNGFELVELNPETFSDSDVEDDFVETTGMKRIIQSLEAHTWPNLVLKDSRTTVSPYIRQLMQEEHDAKKLAKNSTDDTNNTNTQCDDNNQSTESTENKTDQSSESTENKTDQSSESTENKTDQSSESTENQPELSESQDVCDKCDTGDAVVNGEAVGGSAREQDNSATGKTKQKKHKQKSKEETIDSLLPADDLKLFEAIGSEDPDGESFEKLFEKFASMKSKANGLPLEQRKQYAEQVAIAFWQAMGGDEDEIGDLDD